MSKFDNFADYFFYCFCVSEWLLCQMISENGVDAEEESVSKNDSVGNSKGTQLSKNDSVGNGRGTSLNRIYFCSIDWKKIRIQFVFRCFAVLSVVNMNYWHFLLMSRILIISLLLKVSRKAIRIWCNFW